MSTYPQRCKRIQIVVLIAHKQTEVYGEFNERESRGVRVQLTQRCARSRTLAHPYKAGGRRPVTS